jgi:hypothetical protein
VDTSTNTISKEAANVEQAVNEHDETAPKTEEARPQEPEEAKASLQSGVSAIIDHRIAYYRSRVS